MTHEVVVSPDWFGYIRVSSQLCCSSSWALRGWEKREKKFFSGLFRSLKKKCIHLKDKNFKCFDTEPTRKQSEIKNSSEGEETCAQRGTQLSLPTTPHCHSFSFRRSCCRYRAWSTSGDFTLGLWSSAYSDPSRRNRTKSLWKSECNNFQAFCNSLNNNNNPIALSSRLFLT